MTKLKFQSDILQSSNKSISHKSFCKYFLKLFFINIKMSKNISAK